MSWNTYLFEVGFIPTTKVFNYTHTFFLLPPNFFLLCKRFISITRALETTCDRSRVKVKRDCDRSKDRRKKEAIETYEENVDEKEYSEQLRVKGHSYNAKTIQQALEMLIDCGISFRAIEKVFELFNSESQTTPSFTCIRKWLGRIGMYELQREKEYRDDWIFIADFTIELGKKKAFVILGVTQQHLMNKIMNKQG